MIAGLRTDKGIYPLLALLAATLLFACGLLFVRQSWFWLFLLLLALLFIGFGYGRSLIRILLVFLPLSAVAFLLSLASAGPPQALAHALRTVLLGLCAVPTLSMVPVDLVRNLNQLRVPRYLTTGILISLRFIPLLAEESRRIRLAMRLRGIRVGYHRLGMLYRAFFVPLIMRLISISDTLAVSLETRAFVLDRQATAYKVIRFRARDMAFAMAVLALLTSGFMLLAGRWMVVW